MRGRLTPELGAVVQRALEAASDRLFRESASALRHDATAEVTPAQRRADSLGLLAESALASALDRGTAGDRCQVVIHVDEDTLKEDAGPTAGDAVTSDTGQAVLEDANGTYVSYETRRKTQDVAVPSDGRTTRMWVMATTVSGLRGAAKLHGGFR